MGRRTRKAGSDGKRADAVRNEARILAAAERLLEHSPSASLSDVAAAAGVSRSTLYRRFANRDQLLAKLGERPAAGTSQQARDPLPTGRLGRQRPLPLDAIQVFDV